MSKSIRVNITRTNSTTDWPFDTFLDAVANAFTELEAAGVQSWIKGNEDADNAIIVDHYFPTNELFTSYQEDAYKIIPIWKTTENSSEVDIYHATNNIGCAITEVADPDLDGYERITLERRVMGPK